MDETAQARKSEYEYEGYPLVKRIVALAADVHPSEVDSTDGSYQDVEGLLAERDYASSLAIAETLGLTGDWETDDVTEAIATALHEYRELRTALAAAATPAPPAVLVERDGRRWLCPVGAPQEHPWLVPVDWGELICSLCVEDEKCCECDIPDLITLIEHKTRVWAGQSTPAPPVDGECSGCGEVHGDEPCGWYERPPEPTLAEYEQYIRKQVAEEPYSTYARGVVRDLLVELDRLRAIEERARAVVEDTGKSEPVHRNARYILGEKEAR